MVEMESEEEPAQIFRHTYGLIVVNSRYDKSQDRLQDVKFAEAELARIEPVFQRLCQDKVTVIKDAKSKELEQYLEDLFCEMQQQYQQDKISGEVDGKRGQALIFHYIGQGCSENGFTCMFVNEQYEQRQNPFPIEQRLRSFAYIYNTFVLASINCCRNQFKQYPTLIVSPIKEDELTLGGPLKKSKGQIFLKFASPHNQSAPATEQFGIKYAENLEKALKKGYIQLPEDLVKSRGYNVPEMEQSVLLIDIEASKKIQNPLNQYKGQELEGKRHGQGKQTWLNGAQYEGEWKYDKPNGKGIYTAANGYQYEGEFEGGSINGKGTIIPPAKRTPLQLIFKKDKLIEVVGEIKINEIKIVLN